MSGSSLFLNFRVYFGIQGVINLVGRKGGFWLILEGVSFVNCLDLQVCFEVSIRGQMLEDYVKQNVCFF